MANIIPKSGPGFAICSLALSYLRNLPLYDESHSILTKIHENSTSISYWTKGCQREPDQTKFDIQIKDDICDILYFNIKSSERNKGNRKSLYSAIEKFAKSLDCKKIQTTPSGMGENFWPKLGFTKKCDVGLEKIL